MRRKILLFMAILTSLITARAQEVDHVYLKTGSVIRGSLEEVIPDEGVRITDLSGNTWNFQFSEVEKISRESYEGLSDGIRDASFGSGFVNSTSIGFLAGSAENMQVAPFSLLLVNGWRYPWGLFTGVGTGIEFLSTNYLPLFLDLRFDLMQGGVVPYVLAKGGYSLPLVGEREDYNNTYAYSGGALGAAGIGLKVRTRNHLAWDVELMYRYQRTSRSESYEWNGQTNTFIDVYNRIEIRLGFYID